MLLSGSLSSLETNSSAAALSKLRKESLDLYNRLHSIKEDVAFVANICSCYRHIPVIPNLRCGSWYVDPATARPESAYFKSTDGHYRNWSFNLRRPNLHLLPVAVEYGGFILVDSTRSGKRIPDALSKTVPIWCTVVSRAIQRRYPAQDKAEWNTKLYCPPGSVSHQEVAQIEERIPEWVHALSNSSYTLPDLPRPLRPFWITPTTSTLPTLPDSVIPVVCVSASRAVSEGVERRSSGFAYVQGSGDDHELWGMGLTPQLFWERKVDLLGADRSTLPSLVESVVQHHKPSSNLETWSRLPTPIAHVGGRLLISRTGDLPSSLPSHLPDSPEDVSFVIVYAHITDEASTSQAGNAERSQCLRMHLAEGKTGQSAFLEEVCICCETGKDSSAGVAVSALQLFFSDEGDFLADTQTQGKHRVSATKQSIQTRLQWVISSQPEVNPSRATLKRVNEFILSPPTFRHKR